MRSRGRSGSPPPSSSASWPRSGSGMLVSLLHAWLSISVRADQIISGTVINIIALGLTGYLNRLIQPGGSAGTLNALRPPTELLDLPLVGWLFRMFFTSGPDHHRGDLPHHRAPDHALPVPLGPADAGRGRAPPGGRYRGHQRQLGPLPERRPRRDLRGPRRRLAHPRVQRVVPERDDGQPRVHRAGRGDLRPLDADRRVRRRAPVHGLGSARDRDPLQPATGATSGCSSRTSRRPTRACTTTSSARCRTC